MVAAAASVLLLASGAAGAAESPSPGASQETAETPDRGVTTEPTVDCRLPAGQGDTRGPQKITVKLSPATVAPGGTVHVEVELGPTPATSPLALADTPFTAGIEFALSGGADGTVTVFGEPTAVDIPLAPSRIQVPSYEGDFMMPVGARGPVRLTPTRTLTVTRVLDRDHETPCVVRSGVQPVGTVEVAGVAHPAPTLTLPDRRPSEPGAAVALSGAGWTPGGTPRALLCAQDGSACSPAGFTDSSLAVDAAGVLAGTVTLAGADLVAPAAHRVRLFDGAREASARLTVAAPPAAPGAPDPTDLLPERTEDDPAAPATQDPAPSPPPHPDPTAPEGGQADAPHASQHLAAYITPGPLAMDQSGDAVDFGTFELGEQSTATSALNTVTVTDGRGHNIGWSLTATLTDLRTAHGATIPAESVRWKPKCAGQPGSVGRPKAGTPGPLGPQASSLCTMGHHARTPMTGGKFTADAQLTLTVPGFVPPGEYEATLQLTLL
ncbi:WxL domain-containing protein [Streptomyces indicus]|uniref:WxL domain-containing protein n=1 Tax=Streptomyces indicus TaxID=417292 RepID=UPI000B863502|nr:WxL domain-containing protein [Streptomyces indicus]